MTWSYSGNPASSNLDKVRFYIGDTNTNDQILSDEEIEFLIDDEGSAVNASIVACQSIASKYARLADETVGKVSVKYSQKYTQYMSMASKLEEKFALKDLLVYAGGISVADKEDKELDLDIVKPSFKRDTTKNKKTNECNCYEGSCGCS